MTETFVITGASGFLGGHVAEQLLADGKRVVALVRKPLLNKSDGKVPLQLYINFDDVKASIEAIRRLDVQHATFLHFAWPGVNRIGVSDDEIQEKGFALSKRCLEIAFGIGASHFVFCGSRAEYGNCKTVMSEDYRCNPTSAYGSAKYKFHQYALQLCSGKAMAYVNFRPFSVIGKGDHPWSIISSTCKAFSSNQPMEYGPCTQSWNFMGVKDFARAVSLLCDGLDVASARNWNVINVASWDTRTLRSFIEEMRVLSKTKSQTTFSAAANGEEPLSVVPDISRMCELTNWNASETFQDIVKPLLITNGVN